MVQASDEVKLSRGEREAGFLQLDGDGHLAGARVHWKMWDLRGKVIDEPGGGGGEAVSKTP